MSRCKLCDDATPDGGLYCSQACKFLNPRFNGEGTFTRLATRWSGLLVPLPPIAVGSREPAWHHWDRLDRLYVEYEQLLAQQQAEPPGLAAIRQRITQTMTEPRGQRATPWRLLKTADAPLLAAFQERRTQCVDWLTQIVAQNAAFANQERRWRLRKLLERVNRDLIDAPPSFSLVWSSKHWKQNAWVESLYKSQEKMEQKMTPKRDRYLRRPVARLDQLAAEIDQKLEDGDEYYCRVKYMVLQLYAYERIYLLVYLARKADLDEDSLQRIEGTLQTVYDEMVATALATLRGETGPVVTPSYNNSISNALQPLIANALSASASPSEKEKEGDGARSSDSTKKSKKSNKDKDKEKGKEREKKEKRKDKDKDDGARSTDSTKKSKKSKKSGKDKDKDKDKEKNKRTRSGDETRSSDKTTTKKSKKAGKTSNTTNNTNTTNDDARDERDDPEARAAFILQQLHTQSMTDAQRLVLQEMKDMYEMDVREGQ